MDIVLENIIIGKADTTANWGADTTVYSLGFMMISSDATYSGTNVKKWKIANGVDTWTNIDFVPVAETLAKILLKDNKTGGEPIHSDDEYSVLKVINNEIALFIDDGATGGANFLGDYTRAKMRFVEYATFKTGEINIDISRTYIKHSDLIELAAPTINLPQSTASRIVETDASKNLTYAAKGTAYNKNFGTTAGTVTEGNDNRLTNSRGRKYFAYDNTSYSYTGTTANTIVRTIPIEIGDMLENSTLSLMMNFFKIGTNSTFSMFLYITTNPSAATGGTQIGANGTGATASLQFGKHYRLTNKNSLTSQLGQTSGNNADDFSTILNGAKQVLNIDFTVKQYLHIVMKANSALDTVGISDYQAYIDNP